MRIVVHDYGGYPFPFELSAELGRRGHAVEHLFFAQNPIPAHDDGKAGNLSYGVRGLKISKPFRKSSLLQRRLREGEYGRAAAAAITAFRPDVVISANSPLDSQRHIQRACRRAGIPMVFWMQDMIGLATTRILRRKIPLLGAVIGNHYRRMEAAILRQSAAVVAITWSFGDYCFRAGLPPERFHVIENWAPLREIRPVARRNGWSDQHGLSDKIVLLYSGTLGFKHDPSLFERLAVHFRARPEVLIVVVADGAGADWLAARRRELSLDTLLVLPFQPYGLLSEVLGSADILLAVLDAEAGEFSVPSKVLSYLNAGRPVLAAMPPDNLAAEIIRRAGAGATVPAGDCDALIAAAEAMIADPAWRAERGLQARVHAEQLFDITAITDRFESVLRGVLGIAPEDCSVAEPAAEALPVAP